MPWPCSFHCLPPDCPGQHSSFQPSCPVLSSWVPSPHSSGQAWGVSHGPWVSWPGDRGYKGLEARQGTSEMPSAGSGDPLDEGAAVEEGRNQHSSTPYISQGWINSLLGERSQEGGCFSWGATRGAPAVSTRLADMGCSLLLWGPGLAGLGRMPFAGGGLGGRAGCVCCVAWDPAGSRGCFCLF